MQNYGTIKKVKFMNIKLKLSGSEVQSLQYIMDVLAQEILNKLSSTFEYFELEVLERASDKLKKVLIGVPRKAYRILIDGRDFCLIVAAVGGSVITFGVYEDMLITKIMTKFSLEVESLIHHRKCLHGAAREDF